MILIPSLLFYQASYEIMYKRPFSYKIIKKRHTSCLDLQHWEKGGDMFKTLWTTLQKLALPKAGV